MKPKGKLKLTKSNVTSEVKSNFPLTSFNFSLSAKAIGKVKFNEVK